MGFIRLAGNCRSYRFFFVSFFCYFSLCVFFFLCSFPRFCFKGPHSLNDLRGCHDRNQSKQTKDNHLKLLNNMSVQNKNKRNSRPTGPTFSQKKKQKKSASSSSLHKNKASNDYQVVNLNALPWKKIEINENEVTNSDFGGFYGLEEIDGVGLKEIDGKLQFVSTKAPTDTTAKDESDGKETKVPPHTMDDIEFDEDATMEDLIEFKNLDDIQPGELSVASGSDDEWDASDAEEIQEKLQSEVQGEEEESDTNEDPDRDLKQNTFNLLADVLDIEDGDQPPMLEEWNALNCHLSYTTMQGLANLGFTKPTEIQAKCLPLAINEHRDILGKASTGSGKTLAYGIPILEKLVSKVKTTTSASTKNGKKKDIEDDIPVAVIFTPTRELAHQVTEHLSNLAKHLIKNNPYMILSLTGGLSIQKQERLLMKYKGNAKIVVATPGRFLELLEKNQQLIQRFSRIDYLVLDEADRLLQDGHFDEFEKIMKFLSRSAKKINPQKYWQTLVFSATFSLDLFHKLDNTSWKNLKSKQNDQDSEMEQVVKHLMSKIHFGSKPLVVDTNPEQKVASQIKESLIECLPTERDLFVYYFVTMFPQTSLVFCNSIDSVKKLNSYLNNLKISCFQIHSSMTQKNRLKNLERFKEISKKNTVLGKPTVLIASDVAARGLDIPNISHVIHYHLPRTADVYIHRSGRTARGENSEGVSVMICSPQEAMGPLRKLRKLLHSEKPSDIVNAKGNPVTNKKKWQKDVKPLVIESDILTQLKKRSSIANELANHEIASKSLSKEENWLKQAADDLGIDLDSDEEDRDVILAKNKLKKVNKTLDKNEVNTLRYQLNVLLQEPIRKDLRRSYLTGGAVNLADFIVKNKGHNNIIGHEKTDALEQLKKKGKNKNKSKN